MPVETHRKRSLRGRKKSTTGPNSVLLHDYTDEPPLKQRSEGQEFVSAKHAAHVEEEESLYVHRVEREADRD